MTVQRRVTASRAGTIVGLAMALAGIGSSATSVVLPEISAALGLGPVGTAWVLGGFVVGVAVSAPVYGRVSDRFGTRWPIAIGMALLAVGSVVAACAWHPAVLYLGRVLTGAGAGSIPTLSGVLLSDRFEHGERSEALARCGALAVGAALGVLVGGVVDAVLGWRAVLLLPVLILLVAPFVVGIASSHRLPGRTDWKGIGWVAMAVVGLVLALQGPTSGPTVAALGVVMLAVAIPLLVRHTRRDPTGLLPVAITSDRVLITTTLAGMAVPGAYYAALVLVPSALVRDYGWSPMKIGLALLPAALIGILAPRALRRLPLPMSRVTAGSIALGGVSLVISGIVIDNGFAVAGAAVGVTVCFGVSQGALVDRISNSAAAPRGGLIGAYTLVFFVGGTISSGLAGLFSAVLSPTAAFMLLGSLVLSAALLLALTWREPGRPGRVPVQPGLTR